MGKRNNSHQWNGVTPQGEGLLLVGDFTPKSLLEPFEAFNVHPRSGRKEVQSEMARVRWVVRAGGRRRGGAAGSRSLLGAPVWVNSRRRRSSPHSCRMCPFPINGRQRSTHPTPANTSQDPPLNIEGLFEQPGTCLTVINRADAV